MPDSRDPNAIDPRVFPRTARRDPETGELVLQGVTASALAARYGTPLYVVDEQEARGRAREARRAFEREFRRIGADAKVYYAGKAFLCIEVAQWMRDEGLGIDVASGGELALALAAGIDPAHIGLHGNNKSEDEIDRAVRAGVGAIVIDSEQEIERIIHAARKHGVVQRVRLRVNSGVHAGAHEFLATGHEDQKFGLPLDQAVRVARRIRQSEHLSFLGLHGHIGSQIFATSAFREAAGRLLAVSAELAADGTVPELNLGGGFGIAYTSSDADGVPDFGTIAREIADIVAETCSELGLPVPVCAFEPGRSIIGPSGVTLYTVGTTKPVVLAGSDHAQDPRDAGASERWYVSVDGGMSDNARPALYGAEYQARLAGRRSDAPDVLVRVVGKHCESGDIVVDRDRLPGDVRPGDLLAVPATGAYCWSLSSNYNYLPRPPVVAVSDGEARLIVRGQTEADLIAQSVDPRHEPAREVVSDSGARTDSPINEQQNGATE